MPARTPGDLLGLIAMPRTGHRAVMAWMRQGTGEFVKNIEGFEFDRSVKRAKIQKVTPWMLIRDFPNWLAACIAFYPAFVNLPPMIDAWITHAENIGNVPTILYPEWVAAGHGNGITGFDSGFDSGSVLTRYQQMQGSEIFERHMRDRTDALELNRQIFPEVQYAY